MPFALRCLVVEDQDFQRAALIDMLKGLGAAVVHQAANGLQAERMLRSLGTELDLIVTDLMMPDRDGIELLAAIRARAPHAGLVICSIDDVCLPAAQAIAEGMGLRLLGTILKPVSPATLSSLVAKMEHD